MTTAEELSALALFEGCATEDLARVAAAVTGTRNIADGEVICREGEVADRWWIVVDGMANVTAGGIYLDTIGPGETIGELALLDGAPRNATVTAATDMVLEEVSGEGFVAALLESPSLSVALLRELAVRLRGAALRQPRAAAAQVAVRAPARKIAPASQLDPLADGYFDDPLIQLAALREHAPVHWSDVLGSFVVLRYDDVHRLMRDRALLGSVGTFDPMATLAGVPAERARNRRTDKMMIRRDGDEHHRLRRLVAKVFTPRAIQLWRDRAEQVVDGLLADVAERGKFDVIADFAFPLPVQIITEMLGMPKDNIPQLREWSHALTRGLDPFVTAEEEATITTAGRKMFEYLEHVVEEKRAHLADDILSDLIRAEDEGDRLDAEEIQAQVMLLFIAGHETTVNLIGNGITHLFRFPEQLDALRADAGLDANAIEELLRFESPAQFTRRVNSEPLELHGVEIPRGSLLSLSIASANHDPSKWGETADAIDVARPGAAEHVSFGGGPHFCLGAALARLEAQVALPRLVRAFPRLEPAYAAPAWARRMVLRGVETLPVVAG